MGLVTGFFSLWVIAEACRILAFMKEQIVMGKESVILYLNGAEQCKASLGRGDFRWLCAPLIEIWPCAGLLVSLQISLLFEVFHWPVLSVCCNSCIRVIQSCPDPFYDQHWGLLSSEVPGFCWRGDCRMGCAQQHRKIIGDQINGCWNPNTYLSGSRYS